MHVKLERFRFGENLTLGELLIDGEFECFTLEDRYRQQKDRPVEMWKIKGKTAIPSGTYPLVITFSNRFQKLMPEILNVPGFTGIRIHPGNTELDTEGCVVVGTAHTDNALLNSRKAFDVLFEKLIANKDGMTIEIL